MNEAILFWSYLGVLTSVRLKKIKALFGDLTLAQRHFSADLLHQLGCDDERVAFTLKRAQQFNLPLVEQTLAQLKVHILFIDESHYPETLKNIPCPPVFLFVRGHLLPSAKILAVVGTRRITAYGQFATEKIVHELVAADFAIVSGLAMGVDACAHRSALKANGTTIAVLGSGIDDITPRQNHALGEQILAQGGAIISEYPLHTKPEPYYFPQRNRIISGLCRGTLVTEGGIDSGALITARYALDQGRDVFAIPGNIQQPGMAGTNHLIKRGEAKLIESAQDILDEYQLAPVKQRALPLNVDDHENRLLQQLSSGSKTIDELSERLTWNVSRLSELLVSLQLKGCVKEIGREWVLI